MDITKIEELPLKELTSRREELIIVCQEMDIAVVARRYMQARIDATMRDGKMAQQAKTLEALQTGLSAAQERVEAIHVAASARISAAEQAQSHQLGTIENQTRVIAVGEALIAEHEATLAKVQNDYRAAKQLAKARRMALAEVMAHANMLLTKVAPLLANED